MFYTAEHGSLSNHLFTKQYFINTTAIKKMKKLHLLSLLHRMFIFFSYVQYYKLFYKFWTRHYLQGDVFILNRVAIWLLHLPRNRNLVFYFIAYSANRFILKDANSRLSHCTTYCSLKLFMGRYSDMSRSISPAYLSLCAPILAFPFM